MKKTLLTLGCILMVAGFSSAAVTGTAHDLRGTIGGSQICVPCHTPHHANPDIPLWNHDLSGNTFTVYQTSPTLDATDITDFTGGDGSVSSLCMSCHDGTVALGAVVNDPGDFGPGATGTIGANGDLGTDLTNDHPINFTFDGALVTADGELQLPTNAILFGGKMECGSCHDVHDNTNPPFLVTTNAGSALCLDCHIK